MKSLSFHTAAVLADSINDASSTRKVYLLAAALAVLGIALVVITVWFWRSTRHDPELLAPLEAMGARRFRRLDGGAQQQVLDRARPADAKPMRWGVVRGEASGDSEIDLRESLRTVPAGFDDLRDPALIAVALEAPPGETVEPAEPADMVEAGEAAPAAAVEPADVAAPVAAADREPAMAPAAEDPLAAIDAMLVGSAAAPERTEASGDEPEVEPVLAREPEPEGTDLADTAERAARRAAASAPPDLAPTDAAAIRTAVDRPSASAPERPRGSKPGVAPEAVPLVIVPIDHELRPSTSRPERRAEPAPVAQPGDDTAAAARPEDDEVAAAESRPIDPLLRMFDRHDG